MPVFFYTPNAPRGTFRSRLPYDEQPATDRWLVHYGNSIVLTALAQRAPLAEHRAQARSELETAERKMAYWLRHSNWDSRLAGRLATRARDMAELRVRSILEHLPTVVGRGTGWPL